MLYLEQRLCERGVRLAQHDDVRSRGVPLALQCEGLQGGSDFDVAAVQDAQHCAQRDGVLSRGDDVRVRPLAPPSHRARLDGEKIRQPMLALRGRVREQRVRAVRLIGDDVANRPATAAPGVREIPRSFARVITARPGLEPVKWDLDGRGQVGARGFRENSHPAVVMLIGARRRPRVVRRIDRDPGLPLPGQLPRHFRTECVHAVDQQGIDVRLDGIEIGRQE